MQPSHICKYLLRFGMLARQINVSHYFRQAIFKCAAVHMKCARQIPTPMAFIVCVCMPYKSHCAINILHLVNMTIYNGELRYQ